LPDADQRASDRQPIGDRVVELALQHFYRLTPAQQLRAFDEERRFLLAAGETLDRSADELAERAEALRVMGQAAEHLGLADGTAPNGPQFRQGLIALGLAPGWSERRVREAFGRWRARSTPPARGATSRPNTTSSRSAR